MKTGVQAIMMAVGILAILGAIYGLNQPPWTGGAGAALLITAILFGFSHTQGERVKSSILALSIGCLGLGLLLVIGALDWEDPFAETQMITGLILTLLGFVLFVVVNRD